MSPWGHKPKSTAATSWSAATLKADLKSLAIIMFGQEPATDMMRNIFDETTGAKRRSGPIPARTSKAVRESNRRRTDAPAPDHNAPRACRRRA
jgi:hypothetical protein